MARAPSFTGDIELTPMAPVAKPKLATAPDLTKWVATLRNVDAQTRAAGKPNTAIPFNLPAAAVKTARLRFGQAAAEIGIGVSFAEEKVNDTVTKLLVSTADRRERKPKEITTATAPVAAVAGAKPAPPVGLPKPKEITTATAPVAAVAGAKPAPPVGLPKPKEITTATAPEAAVAGGKPAPPVGLPKPKAKAS